MKHIIFICFMLSMTIIGFIILYHVVYEDGYKAACGDFYKGKLKYDLVTNPDGTRVWKKIKK